MRRTLTALVIGLSLVAAACGTGENPALQPPEGTPTEAPSDAEQEIPGGAVRAELEEWSITLSEDSVPAGEVSFAAENTGQVDHEFLVIDTDLAPDELPQTDGKVDEDAEGLEVVGEIDNVSSDSTRVLSTELRAGEYVVICNIVGHYDSGMHAPLTVE